MSAGDPLDPMSIWRRLAYAATDRQAGFREMALATVGLDGAPQNRTVVLRGVDEARARIWLHTDRRSPKAAEIASQARVSLLFWDAKARLQLRCAATATLRFDDALVDAEWSRLSDAQKTIYAGPRAPGAPLDGPSTPALDRAAFCVVDCALTAIDALYLGREGHRRILLAPPAVGGAARATTP